MFIYDEDLYPLFTELSIELDVDEVEPLLTQDFYPITNEISEYMYAEDF